MNKKTPKSTDAQRMKIDISKYDRTTIIWKVRAAYRRGFSEINIYYKNISTSHLRKENKLFVRDVVRDQVVRMLGAKIEVIDAHNSKLYVDYPQGNIPEISNRIIRKMIELHAEMILLVKGHLYAASLIEEKHDTLTKLVTYCQLLITRQPHDVRATIEHHILACVDKISDLIKYMSRDYITVERPMSRTAIAMLSAVQEQLIIYEQVHFTCKPADVVELTMKRDEIKRSIRGCLRNIDPKEAFILGQETSIIEILADMLEFRMALED